jgi:hypothetical protein
MIPKTFVEAGRPRMPEFSTQGDRRSVDERGLPAQGTPDSASIDIEAVHPMHQGPTMVAWRFRCDVQLRWRPVRDSNPCYRRERAVS